LKTRARRRGAADQLARRQPGAGRHHQRRNPRLKAKHKKPVYAVVEETCASAAYYIAAAADKIFVDKASIVGSIGVLMDGFGFTGLMDKLGVERRLMTAGENKGFLDPFSPQTEKQRAYAQAMLDQIHKQFIDTVKAGRGKRLKETPETFSGLFWSGQQAIELGLADQLGNLDYVAREVVKAEDLVDYTRRDNVAERLAKRFGAAMGEGAVRALKACRPFAEASGPRQRPMREHGRRACRHRASCGFQALAVCRCGTGRRAASEPLLTARRVLCCRVCSSACQQRRIAVGRFDEQLGLPGLERQRFQFADAPCALGPGLAAGNPQRRSSGR
jgi:signal peptide peptidase SppA